MARPRTPVLPPEKTLISEVLQRVSNAKTKTQKVKILKDYNTKALRTVLLCNYSSNIQFMFPPGRTPYNTNLNEGEEHPVGIEHTWLMSEHRQIEKFIKKTVNGQVFYGDSMGLRPNIPQLRKEQLWIQLLEGLHPDEAEVLDLAKDKALGDRFKITKQNVIDAFPELRLS